jgi:hypothetical protein
VFNPKFGVDIVISVPGGEDAGIGLLLRVLPMEFAANEEHGRNNYQI